MAPFTSRLLLYVGIVSISGFLFGFDASVISGVGALVTRAYGLTAWEQGLLVSAPALAALFASLAAGRLCDAFGRKRVLIGIALLYVSSTLFTALADGYVELVLARAMGGLAFASLVVAPLYIAEIAPPQYRGRLVSLNQLGIVLGFSAAYFANALVLGASTTAGGWSALPLLSDEPWRYMLAAELLPALAFLVALPLIPESPRWLASRGRTDPAQRVLQRLAPDTSLAEPMTVTASTAQASPVVSGRALDLLRRPAVRYPLIVGLVVAVAQQITGVNAVYFYAPMIFEQSGAGTASAFAQAVWIGLVNVVFTVVALGLIDRVGRKPLLLVGTFWGVLEYGDARVRILRRRFLPD